MTTGVQITGIIVPLNGGNFAVTSDVYQYSGFRIVDDNTARDAITAERRRAGMWVYVKTTNLSYTLNNDLTTWTQRGIAGTPSLTTFVGWDGTQPFWTTVPNPIAFGLVTQIPVMNVTNDNFTYSANFTFNGTGLIIKPAGAFLTLAPAGVAVAAAGEVRLPQVFSIKAQVTTAPLDRFIVSYVSTNAAATDRLTFGCDNSFANAVAQIGIRATTDLTIGLNATAAIGLQWNGTSIGYNAETHSFANQPGGSGTTLLTIGGSVTGLVQFTAGTPLPTVNQANLSGSGVTGQTLTVIAQSLTASSDGTAGILALKGGGTSKSAAATLFVGGDILVQGGIAAGVAGTQNGGNARLLVGTGATNDGNISLCYLAGNFQGMNGGIFQGNARVSPTANPASGGFGYVVAGANTWRGSGGTITVMGAA